MKRSPIKRVSKKRQQDLAKYRKLRLVFLETHPICAIKSKVCTGFSTDVHHARGRVGRFFLDESTWMASCNPCNLYIEANKKWAFERGFRKDRLGNL